MRKRQRWQSGLSLIEILVVVAIVGLLLVALLWWFSPQLGKGRDAKRKADLNEIKTAFEDYYNDNYCYPPSDVLQNCGSQDFRPYLDTIPCDTGTGQPYQYIPLDSSGCTGYRIFATLENKNDPAIAQLSCDTSCGCGFGEEYNYGISAGTTLAQDECTPLSTPEPTAAATPTPAPTSVPTPVPTASPSPTPAGPTPVPLEGEYTCDPAGVCNFTYYPIPSNCPVSFLEFDCQNQCGVPANRCM
jgi:prepilin-type N-terminal cleavage/methylation domain-containing protein